MAKNITLAIDEALLDKVRVLAAIKHTSVNEMVRQFLEREVQREVQSDEARAELLELMDDSEGQLGGWTWNREEIYSGEPRFDRWK